MASTKKRLRRRPPRAGERRKPSERTYCSAEVCELLGEIRDLNLEYRARFEWFEDTVSRALQESATRLQIRFADAIAFACGDMTSKESP
jgi:hypothetical protein